MKRKKGQAIVEMALLFPFFLLVIVGGIIDFGFAFYNSLTLQQLANDCAQWAADNKFTSNEVINNFIAERKPVWWQGTFTIGNPEQVDLESGGTVLKIRLQYESPTYTPFYQTMLQGITGSPSIKLAALASYKMPEHVYTRM